MNLKLKTLLLLLLWIGIGTGLRFTQLAQKSPWTDEFATMVFSLGNGFAGVPLDKAIALDTLMQPLQPNSAAGIGDVIDHLLKEDHHPPVYFVLAHLWSRLFPPESGLISLWGARSLPALLGAASIPAVYGLARIAFNSPLVGQLAAAMMAVSPYGIFIAQEARHYTLATLWVIASLTCLVIATRHIQHRTLLPVWLILSWVGINVLGLSTHYFFTLTLAAEAIVLIGFGWHQISKKDKRNTSTFNPPDKAGGGYLEILNPQSSWWRIYAVAGGTLAGGLVWLLVWQHSYNSQMTEWIQSNQHSFLDWINPLFQSFGTWMTMISLLPVEASALPVVIVSGIVELIFFIWAIPLLYRGIKTQWQQRSTRLATSVLGGFVLGAIALFFGIRYSLGIDLTRGARYNFVYFPIVIVLVGASLAICWEEFRSKKSKTLLNIDGKKVVALIWLMGFVSAITVVSNLGYRKYYRPDILVPIIQQTSSVPVLIATTHNTLVQTGEMMGIGWEFIRAANLNPLISPQFLLAHQEQNICTGDTCRASTILQQALTKIPQPVDLWLVNFKAPIKLESQNCLADTRSFESVYGYDYKLYHCGSRE